MYTGAVEVALASSKAMDSTVVCYNCNDEVKYAFSRVWSAQHRSCITCAKNYKRQCDRMAICGDLKKWWKSLDKGEKTAWFQKNKLINADTDNDGPHVSYFSVL